MLPIFYGLLASLSPCSFPLIPIILGICKDAKHTLAYLAGSTVSYLILGLVVSTVGIYFENALHHWITLLVFTGILGTLALISFDVIHFPTRYIRTENVFLMGITAPLICSPCMTPFLGGIIIKMMVEHCRLCAVSDLLLFGLGVSIPLVLTLFGLNRLFQKIKNIMPYITKVNGLLLIGLIIYLWLPYF